MRAAKSKARSSFSLYTDRYGNQSGALRIVLSGGHMRRIVLIILSIALLAVLPLWPFNRHWTYGPAIAVAFLLIVNLLVVAGDFFGRRTDRRDPNTLR